MKKFLLSLFIIFISTIAVKAEEYTNDIFKYGVASGDPLQNKVILWTKVEAFEGKVKVDYEVSTTNDFSHIVSSGVALTNPEKDYTLKVDIDNLRPETTYYYRFKYNNTYSPVGTTRTLPVNPRRFKIAVVSCQNYSDGYFNAYQYIVADKPDLIVMLGDFVYEYARTNPTRKDPSGYAKDLKSYRKKYQTYLQEPRLREAMTKIPMIAIWDDHEVMNDYSGVQMMKNDPQRLKDAYQTYFNYIPIREQSYNNSPEGAPVSINPESDTRSIHNTNKIYRNFKIGDLLEIFMIDGRQYRDEDPCDETLRIDFDCTRKAYRDDHTYLGKEQLNWLIDGLVNSKAEWKMMGNNTALFELSYFGNFFNFDQWDGFYAEKQHFLSSINDKVNNLILLTGDIHTFIQADIIYKRKKIASEFTATSISSRSPAIVNVLGNLIPFLVPQVKYFNTANRGYILADFSTRKTDIYFYGVSTVEKPESTKLMLRHMEVWRKRQ